MLSRCPFKKRSGYMKNNTSVMVPVAVISAAIGLLISVLVDSIFEVIPLNWSKVFSQLGVVSLILALGILIPTIMQNNIVNDNLKQIRELLDESNSQNPSPEGNIRRNIVLSELQEDSDTKTITTQYESDGVTVTSTLKITIRKE